MDPKLAIDGGTPTTKEKFPMWPTFNEASIQAAMEPLRSGLVNYWTGHKGTEFEEKFAAWNGAKYAISTTNGTAALHTALAALDIGSGDEVICPSYSFIASSFCILQAGAIPVFADVTDDHTLDPASIAEKITSKTKAILVVHLYGIVADMRPILAIAKKHGLKVIEDCAQCFGGVYQGVKTGLLGDAGCYSFCQSKHFTTGGEGGMVVTNDENLAWESRSFRDHGYDVKERLRLLELESKLMYIHNRVGFNYRLTESQSAIGIEQLKIFDSWNLANRRRNGKMIGKAFADHPQVEKVAVDTEERQNSYWWAPINLRMETLSVDIKQIAKAVSAEGVPIYTVLWPRMYKEKAFSEQRGFGNRNYPFKDPASSPQDYTKTSCPRAEKLEKKVLSFFTHPVYDECQMQMMIDAVKKVLAAYAK